MHVHEPSCNSLWRVLLDDYVFRDLELHQLLGLLILGLLSLPWSLRIQSSRASSTSSSSSQSTQGLHACFWVRGPFESSASLICIHWKKNLAFGCNMFSSRVASCKRLWPMLDFFLWEHKLKMKLSSIDDRWNSSLEGGFYALPRGNKILIKSFKLSF